MIRVWQAGEVVEISECNECGSKENSLSECRNKNFICSKAHLLALFSEKLRRLKYGLISQDPCSKSAFSPYSSRG